VPTVQLIASAPKFRSLVRMRQTRASWSSMGFVTLSALTLVAMTTSELPAKTVAQTIDDRITELLGQMTLPEKIGQLNLLSHGEPIDEQLDAVRTGKVGSMMNVVDAGSIARYKQAAAESRLKIPLLFGLDAIDVFRIAFPPPLAWAATWHPELAEAAAKAVARETAASGVNWTFAPMVDISRDPRWGRVVEGAGEDPVLGASMAAARVRGYQDGGLIATAKHYVGYGAGEAGRDYNSALIPTSELYDRHLPPFRAAIAAGAPTVMGALNAINGVPAHVNRFLLETVLRRDIGFTGFVVSDYDAIGELINHGVAVDLKMASALAIKAGIDMDMEGTGFDKHLANEVAANRVALSDIDQAVTRVLRVKFQHPTYLLNPPPPAPAESETRAVARQVSRESFVLLKNDNATLPIATGVKRIAVIGDAARSEHDESWYGPALLTKPATQTILEAMKERLAPGQSLIFAPAFTDHCQKTVGDGDGAIAAAKAADIIVYIVTEDCEFSGEGTSRTNLDLSDAQLHVLDRLALTGKPIALVVTAARPLTLGRVAGKVDAILFAWLPRTEGRTVIAEMLAGSVNPSGKLPMSFPRSVGQIPISYNVLPTSRPPKDNRYTSRYLDEDVTPLYPFGHGLSYTTFAYSNLTVPPALNRSGGSVSVTVTNTGSRTGEDVVQIYTRQPVASRSRPIRELKAFRKIKLRPGESQTLSFAVTPADFAFHDDTGKTLIEPGKIQVFAGGSSTATLSGTFDLK
jgi:beta-glucosidase